MIQPSRIDRERLNAVDFPIRVDVPIRFNDLDVLGHVNNTAAGVILQEARVSFSQRAALPTLGAGFRSVVAGLRIEFAVELHHPGVVEVFMGIVAIVAGIERLRVATRQQPPAWCRGSGATRSR